MNPVKPNYHYNEAPPTSHPNGKLLYLLISCESQLYNWHELNYFIYYMERNESNPSCDIWHAKDIILLRFQDL